jgi:MFS family permease
MRVGACFLQAMATDSDMGNGRHAGALTFCLLFSLESLVRSLNAAVLSTQAYDLLGSSQKVSVLSTYVSLTVLITTLLMPVILGRFRRRWAYTMGVVFLMIGAGFLATNTIAGQFVGAYFRNAGSSIANVTLQLYILDHIKKSDLTRSEPLRLATSTLAWVLGPAAGIWLYETYGSVAPQLVSVAMGFVLLSAFWYLRLHENSVLRAGNLRAFRPLSNILRFASQPRLRLAWAIAFWRSCFWASLFTYGPLLMIEGGLSKQAGGWLISASQVMLLATVLFGKFARKHGVRPVVTTSFLVMTVATTAAGFSGSHNPILTSLLLLIAALFCSGLDAVGAIPFLRAVRPMERPRMTPVYRTFIELSDLLPGFVFAGVLLIFPTGAAFVILGLSMLVIAWLSWVYIPKSM